MPILVSPAPLPRLQFFNANGQPLAAGQVWTYAAGTTTPQATYTDGTGASVNTNPVLLDAGGFGDFWLANGQSYKFVVQDANGVTTESVDNLSSVSQAELAGANTFTGLTVNGDATITGNLEVDGAITAASETVSGTLGVSGALTAASLHVTGNSQLDGTLSVTGASNLADLTAADTTVNSLTVGGQTLTAFVTALLPTLSAIAGTLIVTGVATSGNWVIFTFGATAGTRVQIAVGAGTISTGATISLPSGFSSANLFATASINSVDATPGNSLDTLTCNVASGGVVTATGADHSGHTYTGTANWMALTWRTSY
jgi:hypothetical protein